MDSKVTTAKEAGIFEQLQRNLLRISSVSQSPSFYHTKGMFTSVVVAPKNILHNQKSVILIVRVDSHVNRLYRGRCLSS